MSIRWSMLISHHPPCDYDRTWRIGPVRVCVRCLGVAVGTLCSLWYWSGIPGPPILVIVASAVPGVLDFAFHEAGWSRSNQTRRLLTGLVFGLFLAALARALAAGALAEFGLYLGWLLLLQIVSGIVLSRSGRLEALLLRYEEGARTESRP